MSNAVRGFPPEPGEPPHEYPPGPFAAWNRVPAGSRPDSRPDSQPGMRRGDPTRQLAAATITPDEFDTDFSLPAIKDPAPGATRKPPQPPGRAGSAGRAAAGSGGGRRAAATSSRGGMRKAPPGRAAARTGHHSVRIAIAVAAAIVVVVAVVLVLTSGGGNPSGTTAGKHNPTGQPTPQGSHSPSAPGGAWRYIAVRATDPVRLTEQELFPPRFTSAGIAYRRSVAAKSASCHAALIGSSLQAAVHRGGCTQVIRASYQSPATKVMATIGVFNLKTFTSAGAAASAAGRSEFVALLPAKAGPTRLIGQGTGIEYAGVKGHYLVLVYAEFTNLHAPKTSAQRVRLNSFISTLIQQTVNVSLSYRMANGKPPQS